MLFLSTLQYVWVAVRPLVLVRFAARRHAALLTLTALFSVFTHGAYAQDVPAAEAQSGSSAGEPVAVGSKTPPPAQPAVEAMPEDERWNFHAQTTHITQWHNKFRAPYEGPNSLASNGESSETTDLTLFAGLRLWQGAELYANPELDQGFGLSNTLGVAGFPSGGAYKVGNNNPYYKLPRLFLRQTINLGGESQALESAPNQLAGSKSADNITLTVGKFAVVDIFDTNTYAHDPRADFLNWSVIESGAFDYAADAWGYTRGAAVEWTQSWWTVRGGFFAMSATPNSEALDVGFRQHEWVGELEARHQLFGHPGKVKLLAFLNRGEMGRYDEAVSLAQQTGSTPDTSLVRRMATRRGIALNLEQELTPDLGFFARASMNDGNKETFDFTDINQSVSAGLSLSGDRWGRSKDKLGVAFVVNGLSNAAKQYFAAGGLGVLVGDGALNYGTERIAEIYYSCAVMPHVTAGLDYQYIVHPAYNRDRGPVSVVAARLHLDF
ncbi:carbohydrate porin [Ralstonia pickettii]|uniref:Carbohydrate porin n=1 Tax=Ralstonia pickettii TaxID=329 RepID=A0A7X2LDS3_RALPI|nr:carbohydrate porin [Ralstonia pickettii]MRT01613.1 carbohydrate porin [Ralstonia pickettii]